MFDVYNDLYHKGLFTKADLDGFVAVAMLSTEDEQKILGTQAA